MQIQAQGASTSDLASGDMRDIGLRSRAAGVLLSLSLSHGIPVFCFLFLFPVSCVLCALALPLACSLLLLALHSKITRHPPFGLLPLSVGARGASLPLRLTLKKLALALALAAKDSAVPVRSWPWSCGWRLLRAACCVLFAAAICCCRSLQVHLLPRERLHHGGCCRSLQVHLLPRERLHHGGC